MRNRKIALEAMDRQVLLLGRAGENEALCVEFGIKEWKEQYPKARVELFVKTPTGEGYFAALKEKEDAAIWTIGSADTASAGLGEIELILCGEEGERIKSATCRTRILPSPSQAEGREPPEAAKAWTEKVLNAAQEANRAQNAAKESELEAVRSAMEAQDTAIALQKMIEGTDEGWIRYGMLTQEAISGLYAALKPLFEWTDKPVKAVEVLGLNAGWTFAKEGGEQESVDLPHSCNALDGTREDMFRGKSTYTRILTLPEKALYVLCVEAAGQRAQISIDEVEKGVHFTPFQAFAVELGVLEAGEHTLKIALDNTTSRDFIPYSADFNFTNGLDRGVWLAKLPGAHFDFAGMGTERIQVRTAIDGTADIRVRICSAPTGTCLRLTLWGPDAQISAQEETVLTASDDREMNVRLHVKEPTLWHGRDSARLYTVEATLTDGAGILTDRVRTRVGFCQGMVRAGAGFFLNGEKYALHGVNYHQDCADYGSAVPLERMERDLAEINEMGVTFMRMAHYPARHEALDFTDEHGICVYMEIPFVNCFEDYAPYKECIRTALAEMIREYGNHPSIRFWGLSNEVSRGFSGGTESFDKATFDAFIAQLCVQAKTLDGGRVISFVTDKHDKNYFGLGTDMTGFNTYLEWYEKTDINANSYYLNAYGRDQGVALGVTEYGAGCNPYQHEEDAKEIYGGGMALASGNTHPEEYANYIHEKTLALLRAREDIAFYAVWVMYDFAAAGRNEGGQAGINDKGLVTRDRKLRKDAYYLYKAAWADAPVCFIAERRFVQRPSGRMQPKIYSNCDTVTLYANGEMLQTLTKEAAEGPVWTFDEITLSHTPLTLQAVGTRGEQNVQDQAQFAAQMRDGAWKLAGNVGYVPLANYGAHYTLYIELEDITAAAPADEAETFAAIVTTKSAEDTTGYGVASIGMTNKTSGGATRYIFYSHNLGASDTPRAGAERKAIADPYATGVLSLPLNLLGENDTFLLNSTGLHNAETGEERFAFTDGTGMVCAHHGYMYFGAVSDAYCGKDRPLEAYATREELEAALDAGDIHAVTSGVTVKTLIFYAGTDYDTVAQILAHRAQADIDIRFDTRGNPFNAGTGGALIYTNR